MYQIIRNFLFQQLWIQNLNIVCRAKPAKLLFDWYSNLSLSNYAEACNELAGTFRVIAIALVDSATPFEEMPQRWRAGSNIVSDLIGLRFEPQTTVLETFYAWLLLDKNDDIG